MKRKNIVGLIAIVAIIAMTMLAGCVEEETPIPTPTPITTPVATPVPASTLIGEEIQELVIYSDVKDTKVYVNGEYIGVTSGQSEIYPGMFYCDGGNISGGSYKIELQKSGYPPVIDEVQVSPKFDKAPPGKIHRVSFLHEFAASPPTFEELYKEIMKDTIGVEVQYSGDWSGAYGDAGSTKSVDGTGYEYFNMDNPEYVISATFQKQDDLSKKMTVNILIDGDVVKSESTTAAYGVVSISYTL